MNAHEIAASSSVKDCAYPATTWTSQGPQLVWTIVPAWNKPFKQTGIEIQDVVGPNVQPHTLLQHFGSGFHRKSGAVSYAWHKARFIVPVTVAMQDITHRLVT
eukprot:1951465-Amphidinium_carterae.2